MDKNFVIAVLTLISIIGVWNFWSWYSENFHQFTQDGATGMGLIGITLTFIAVGLVPAVLYNCTD